jgi:hypothetical protein
MLKHTLSDFAVIVTQCCSTHQQYTDHKSFELRTDVQPHCQALGSVCTPTDHSNGLEDGSRGIL